MSSKIRKALCCTCGQIRTCRQARNRQRENYWLRGPVDPNWHREVGDLKCANCGQITRHAILCPDSDIFRDHAERITRIALGGGDPMMHVRDRIREAYRQGRQPNPNLRHLWSAADEEAARKARKTTIRTHCGEVMKVSATATASALPDDGQLRPDPVRWEEYEDPDTGAHWIEADCPDCYRVSNERRMAGNRARLKMWLGWLAVNNTERVPDSQVESLLAVLEATQGGAP